MVAQCNDTHPNRRTATGLLAAAIALLMGLAPPTAVAQNLGTVTGSVTDADAGTALVGATVVLRKIGAPAGGSDGPSRSGRRRIHHGRHLPLGHHAPRVVPHTYAGWLSRTSAGRRSTSHCGLRLSTRRPPRTPSAPATTGPSPILRVVPGVSTRPPSIRSSFTRSLGI